MKCSFFVSLILLTSSASGDEELARRSIGFPKNFHPGIEAYKAEHGHAPPKGARDLILGEERLWNHVQPWQNTPEAAAMQGKAFKSVRAKSSNSMLNGSVQQQRMARAARRRAMVDAMDGANAAIVAADMAAYRQMVRRSTPHY